MNLETIINPTIQEVLDETDNGLPLEDVTDFFHEQLQADDWQALKDCQEFAI